MSEMINRADFMDDKATFEEYYNQFVDQKIITGTLETISKKIKEQKISRTAIIIIGDVVKPKSYEYSRLYDKTFSHMFRKGKTSSKN